MTLQLTIAAPFRHSRKDRLKRNEMVFYLSFDRKWMSIPQANQILERASQEGLIAFEGDMIRPLFDVSHVEIPIGFKPSSAVFEQGDPSQDLIRRISQVTGETETQVVAAMHKIVTERFHGHLRPEAALVILAKKNNVPFEDLLEALTDSLLKSE